MLSVAQIYAQKFKEIQSRLPVKMNASSDVSVSFEDVLSNVKAPSTTNNSSLPSTSYMPQIKEAVETAAAKYNIDPNLIMAIIKAESGFNPNSVSSAGAQGLMQLMPSTAQGLGVTDPFDISQNVDAGTKYIKNKIDQFGDVKLALAAYNAGPGAVIKYNGIPPYPETTNYISNVLKYYKTFTK